MARGTLILCLLLKTDDVSWMAHLALVLLAVTSCQAGRVRRQIDVVDIPDIPGGTAPPTAGPPPITPAPTTPTTNNGGGLFGNFNFPPIFNNNFGGGNFNFPGFNGQGGGNTNAGGAGGFGGGFGNPFGTNAGGGTTGGNPFGNNAGGGTTGGNPFNNAGGGAGGAFPPFTGGGINNNNNNNNNNPFPDFPDFGANAGNPTGGNPFGNTAGGNPFGGANAGGNPFGNTGTTNDTDPFGGFTNGFPNRPPGNANNGRPFTFPVFTTRAPRTFPTVGPTAAGNQFPTNLCTPPVFTPLGDRVANTTQGDTTKAAITQQLTSNPQIAQFLAFASQVNGAPVNVQNNENSDLTCPSTLYRATVFQRYGGNCWILQDNQEPFYYAKCNCNQCLATTGFQQSPGSACEPYLMPTAVFAYCENSQNTAIQISRERIALPVTCRCRHAAPSNTQTSLASKTASPTGGAAGGTTGGGIVTVAPGGPVIVVAT